MWEHARPSERVGTLTCRKLDGTGTINVVCQKATFDFFRFDQLPPPGFCNPTLPEYNGCRQSYGAKGHRTARTTIRIAWEGWPGHKKPKMARLGLRGTAIEETWSVIHNHLITQGVPYLYLCNHHGNPLGPNWQAHTGVHA